jgi:hypothetical protein
MGRCGAINEVKIDQRKIASQYIVHSHKPSTP